MDAQRLVLQHLPRVALGVLALVWLWLTVGMLRRREPPTWLSRLRGRPVLVALSTLTAALVLHEALLWASLVPETWVRTKRPLVLPFVWAAVLFVSARLAGAPGKSTTARKVVSDLFAGGTVLALGLVAAGLEVGRPIDKLTVLVAVDRSRSIELVPGAEERVTRELRVAEGGMRPDDRIGVIAFGADAATEEPPRPKTEQTSVQRVTIGRDGTDLAAAIRRSLAEVPSDSAARIVLASDGVATRGDTMSALAAALAAGIPIDVLALEQRKVPDVRVVSLRAPARLDQDEPFDLRLVTSSPVATEIEVRLRRDGQLIATAPAKIAAGEDVLRIKEKAPEPGLHRYEVEVTAKDPSVDQTAEDNQGTAFLRVRGPASALVLDGDGDSAFIAGALRDAAFRVREGKGADVPGDVGELATFDLVVLSDVRASDLSASQVEALASYVRDLGGGLLLMGGDRGLGPGGYAKTGVEEISPVSFDIKQEKRRASLAEVIGIDISGSMGARVGSNTKLELANEGSARSAALLGAGDLLGVAHVDTKVHWSVKLAPVVDKPAIEKAIRGVKVGGGGIFVDITLEAAYGELKKQPAMLKHVLLFADGSDAENMGPCRGQVSDAFRNQITTSVVALGNGSDVPELEVLAKLGGGRFYLVEDATRLPAVFTQETILAARSSIVEKPFRVAKGSGSAVLAGVDVAAAPELGGYVVTIPKPRATVALTGPDGDPILSHWPVGVGKAAAFTSDLKGRWGKAWTSWPGAAKLVAQVGREIARKGDDDRVRLESDASGGELHVRATVVGDDGRAQSFRRLVVHVAGPDGFQREVALEATGAGSYAAAVPLSRPGTYVAVAKDELTQELVGTTGAVLTTGEELRPTGSDLGLLARVAELSGGRRRDTLAGIFRERAKLRFSYDELRGLPLAAALGLLLMVAARRLSLPDVVLALPRRLRGRLRRKPAAVSEPPGTATIDAFARVRVRAAATSQAETAATVRGPVGAAPKPLEPKQLELKPLAQPRAAPAAAPAAGAASPTRAPTPRAAAGAQASGAEAGPTSQRAPSSQRQLSAAEVLLARRRQKKG